MTITDTLPRLPEGCAAALGMFDGVHLGHRAVIERAVRSGLHPAVVTFADDPQAALEPGAAHYRLLSRGLCAAEFARLGVETAVFLDFSAVQAESPADFLDGLAGQMGARLFSCGYDFRFGRGASGDAGSLADYAASHGLRCEIVPPVLRGGEPVSATRIRALVHAGEPERAAELLGRPYAFDFPVVQGDQRGRTIGFPTVNQIFEDAYLLPRFGVYASRTTADGRVYPSVTNVGVRPTFRSDRVLAETHLVGFSGDLYGRSVKVELLRFLRGEQRFDSLEALRARIAADLAEAQTLR